MRVIIAGSRHIYDYDLVATAIEQSGFYITQVVSGKEPNGVDSLGEIWANSLNIPIMPFPADWDQYGPSAGPIRNAAMAKYAEKLILIWDGVSRGSSNMKKEAEKRKLPICEFIVLNGKLLSMKYI